MKLGILRLLSAGTQFFARLKAPSGMTADTTYTLPSAPPANTQALMVNNAGVMSYQDLSALGGGTVTSVGLTAPSLFSVSNSPITSNGDIALALANQASGTIFAGPASGGPGAPGFRAIAYSDVSGIVGSASNTLAAGNDTRFHTQGTDPGTTQQSFQLESGSGGARIKNNSGVLEARNAGDTAYANLVVQNLTVQGTQTVSNTDVVEYGDALITLNADYTGSAPTENGGVEVNRGTLATAQILFDESNDYWVAGIVGNLQRVSRTFRQSFANGDLTSGAIVLTHNLGQRPTFAVYDNLGEAVLPDKVTSTANATTVDLTSFGSITGSWEIVLTA